MRSCDEIVELISASLDGELTADEQTALNEHIACCPTCSALLDDLRALHTAAAQAEEVPAPVGFVDAVMASIAAETPQEKASNVIPFTPRKAKHSHWKQWGVSAAAIAIVLLGAISFPSLMGNFSASEDAAMDMAYARDTAPAAPAEAVMDAVPESEHYTNKAESQTQSKPKVPTAGEPGAAPAPSAAPETVLYVGELVLEGQLDVLKEYEGAACSDGTVTYLVPAKVFAEVLHLLETEKPVGYSYAAGTPDAALGKIVVPSN